MVVKNMNLEHVEQLEEKFVQRTYYCSVCKSVHHIKLRRAIVDNEKDFPVLYPILHGELRDILSIIYLDRDCNIRGVESIKLKDDNLFSKDQVIKISTSLMNEIVRLQKENELLINKINKYNQNK